MNYTTYYFVSLFLVLMMGAILSLSRTRDRLEKQKLELEKLRLAVESAYDHIVISDRSGRVIYANKGAERITGYKVNEIIGQKAGKLWGGLMSREFYRKMWHRIAQSKKIFNGEVTNRRKDGTEYIAQISVAPVLDAGGNVAYFVGIERDITREKEVEQAKSDFISIASHQLKTPLTVIKGYISMLMEGSFGEIPAVQKDIMKKIFESNERQINLVQDLLNLSRIEAGRIKYDFQPGDLGELVASVVDELANTAKEKGLELIFDRPKSLPKASFDKEKLRQVVMNLIENSLKYTPQGRTTVSLKSEGNKITFAVQDTGLGIKQEEMPYLFSKYSRGSDDSTKTKKIKGTGLGLYVGKMIVEAHKGRIWAESKGEGQGSTFAFELPIIA